MIEQEIIEGNKLILQYEGLKPEIKHREVLPKYHENWDWLMPVVLKIMEENQSNNLFLLNKATTTYYTSIYKEKGTAISNIDENPILAVWQAVVNYLKTK